MLRTVGEGQGLGFNRLQFRHGVHPRRSQVQGDGLMAQDCGSSTCTAHAGGIHARKVLCSPTPDLNGEGVRLVQRNIRGLVLRVTATPLPQRPAGSRRRGELFLLQHVGDRPLQSPGGGTRLLGLTLGRRWPSQRFPDFPHPPDHTATPATPPAVPLAGPTLLVLSSHDPAQDSAQSYGDPTPNWSDHWTSSTPPREGP